MSALPLTARQRHHLARFDRDASRLVDCLLELQNNAVREEPCLLEKNLMAAFSICKGIVRRHKTARRLLLNRRNRQ